jgi:tetratricopeptide (TPR) repeat protein
VLQVLQKLAGLLHGARSGKKRRSLSDMASGNFVKCGSLSLKGTVTWSERYLAIDTSCGDGGATLRIYASAAAFGKGQVQSERVIVGARDMGTRRVSLLGSPLKQAGGGGDTRHVIEISLAAGKKAVVAAPDAETQASWMLELRKHVGESGSSSAGPDAADAGGGGGAADADAEAEDAEAERLAAEEAQRAAQRREFLQCFGEAQLRACERAMAAADDGDGVMNRGELTAALLGLGIKLDLGELQALVDRTDVDGDGATDLFEFLEIFTLVKRADAAHKLQRYIRHVSARNALRKGVVAAVASMKQTSERLGYGYEVLKFPRNGKAPQVRMLWLQRSGTLCLDKVRTEMPTKRGVRLESISRVVVGAAHEVFQKSDRKEQFIDGREDALVTVTSTTDGGADLHFSFTDSKTLPAAAAAAAFVAKLLSIKSRLSTCADNDEKRAQAEHYATHGEFESRVQHLLKTYAAAGSPPPRSGRRLPQPAEGQQQQQQQQQRASLACAAEQPVFGAAMSASYLTSLESASDIGLQLEAQGQLDEARPLLEEALVGRRVALGDTHPETLASFNRLGRLLYAQGRLYEARPLYQEALAGCEAALGETHPRTLASRFCVGALLMGEGSLAEALPVLEQVTAGYEDTVGESHPDAQSARRGLELVRKRLGQRSFSPTDF